MSFFFSLSLSGSASPLLLLVVMFFSLSSLLYFPPFPVPSVLCHIEFSQEFEHELIISDSCCSCVCVCARRGKGVRTDALSPPSQRHQHGGHTDCTCVFVHVQTQASTSLLCKRRTHVGPMLHDDTRGSRHTYPRVLLVFFGGPSVFYSHLYITLRPRFSQLLSMNYVSAPYGARIVSSGLSFPT